MWLIFYQYLFRCRFMLETTWDHFKLFVFFDEIYVS